MTLTDKVTWDRFIYGLIYPGFLGSMIYEIIPKSAQNIPFSCSSTISQNVTFVSCFFIIVYFCLDYMHLYGDLDAIIRCPELKTGWYFVCDVLVSILLLVSFIALTWEPAHMVLAIASFGIVPSFFLIYKWRNERDRKFSIWFAISSVLFAAIVIACGSDNEIYKIDLSYIALGQICVASAVYLYYLLKFYEGGSRRIDEEFYEKKRKEKANDKTKCGKDG